MKITGLVFSAVAFGTLLWVGNHSCKSRGTVSNPSLGKGRVVESLYSNKAAPTEVDSSAIRKRFDETADELFQNFMSRFAESRVDESRSNDIERDLIEWAREHPVEALEFVYSLPTDSSVQVFGRNQMLRTIYLTWSRMEPTKAREYLESRPEAAISTVDTSWTGLYEGWATNEANDALTHLKEHVFGPRLPRFPKVFSFTVKSALLADRSRMLEYAESETDSSFKAALFAGVVSNDTFSNSSSWLVAHSAEPYALNAMNRLVRLSESLPDAVEWVSKLPESANRKKVAKTLFQQWARSDQEGLAHWLPKHTSWDLHDLGLEHHALHLSTQASDILPTAMRAAESIQNEETRNSVVNDVLGAWQSVDPEAAEEWEASRKSSAGQSKTGG
ncbi:MAG: hypothetical protein AAF514_10640 [Verrucomicrobiota bacterium]